MQRYETVVFDNAHEFLTWAKENVIDGNNDLTLHLHRLEDDIEFTVNDNPAIYKFLFDTDELISEALTWLGFTVTLK